MEPNQLQAMLYDLGRRKVGIGTGSFHIDDGFIANVCDEMKCINHITLAFGFS